MSNTTRIAELFHIEWERMTVGYCETCHKAHALVDERCRDCRLEGEPSHLA